MATTTEKKKTNTNGLTANQNAVIVKWYEAVHKQTIKEYKKYRKLRNNSTDEDDLLEYSIDSLVNRLRSITDEEAKCWLKLKGEQKTEIIGKIAECAVNSYNGDVDSDRNKYRRLNAVVEENVSQSKGDTTVSEAISAESHSLIQEHLNALAPTANGTESDLYADLKYFIMEEGNVPDGKNVNLLRKVFRLLKSGASLRPPTVDSLDINNHPIVDTKITYPKYLVVNELGNKSLKKKRNTKVEPVTETVKNVKLDDGTFETYLDDEQYQRWTDPSLGLQQSFVNWLQYKGFIDLPTDDTGRFSSSSLRLLDMYSNNTSY